MSQPLGQMSQPLAQPQSQPLSNVFQRQQGGKKRKVHAKKTIKKKRHAKRTRKHHK
jgi:hypothetical protein